MATLLKRGVQFYPSSLKLALHIFKYICSDNFFFIVQTIDTQTLVHTELGVSIRMKDYSSLVLKYLFIGTKSQMCLRYVDRSIWLNTKINLHISDYIVSVVACIIKESIWHVLIITRLTTEAASSVWSANALWTH